MIKINNRFAQYVDEDDMFAVHGLHIVVRLDN